MKKTKVRSHNATKTGSAAFETSAWFCGSEKPNIISPRQPKDSVPSGVGVPSSSHLGSPASWTKFIPKEKCWSFHPCWWQQPGTKLKLIFNLNHLQLPESARYWGASLHGSQSFLHIVGAKVPSALSVPNYLVKDTYVSTKPPRTEMVSASKIIQLMSFGVSSMFTVLSKTLGLLSLRSLSCDINPPGPSHITP